MKHALTLTSLLAASAACAQAPFGVTVYGLLDAGIEAIDNVGTSGDTQWRMPGNTASLPSRWGLRGSEDLGGGLRAVFTLEAGLSLGTGALGQGGRAWGRQAFVGLSGPYGTVTLGRQYTMLFWSLLDADILGPNAHGSGAMDSYIPNARTDNSIAYRGTFNGFTVGATYSLGRDAVNAGPSPAGTNCPGQVAGDSKTCREWALLARYDTAGWGVAAAVDRLHGGPGAFAGLTSSALTDTRTVLNGYYKAGDLKVGGGVMRRKNEANPTPTSNLLFVGAAYQLRPEFQIDGEVFHLDVKNSPNQATLLALRGTYFLSKRTATYVSVGHIRNEGSLALSVSSGSPGSAPAPGTQQSGLLLGVRHSF